MLISYHSTDVIEKGASNMAVKQVLTRHWFVPEPVGFCLGLFVFTKTSKQTTRHLACNIQKLLLCTVP